MMYDTLGTVTIANSRFICNRVPTADVDQVPGGGGVFIEFACCKPNTTNFNTCSPSVEANANYTIINSTFIGNNDSTNEQEATNFISLIRENRLQFGQGGAVSVRFKGCAENNTINVIDCCMKKNQAVWGAGLLVDILDSAKNNRVIIKDVTFHNNSCPIHDGTGGGAIRIHYFPQVEVNSPTNIINITDSRFDSNSAYYGGGISLSTNRERGVLVATNGITIENCTWLNNIARVGSAVDLSSYDDIPEGQLVSPVFINCSYINNSNSYTDSVVRALGLDTIHSDGIPFAFSGDNRFVGNNGTALAVAYTIVHFRENATANFTGNWGLRGGAIVLFGSTVLCVYQNTKLLFVKNKAINKGGAIYSISVGLRDVLNSQKCFIRYHDRHHHYVLGPSEWKTNFTFINNTSHNPGHAIYCTTLIPCSWGNSSMVKTPDILSQTFRWSNVFKYANYNNNTIATDPAFTNVTMETVNIIPGHLYDLNFSIKDDVGVERQTFLFAHNTDDDDDDNDDDDDKSVCSRSGSQFNIYF